MRSSVFPIRWRAVVRAFCIGLLVLVAALAFVTWVSYGDYLVRSQVSEGSSLADGARTAITVYYMNHGAMPRSNLEAELNEPERISGQYVSYVDIGKQPGHIEIGFSSTPPQKAHRSIHGKHLWFDATVQDGKLAWTCRSDEIEQKDCPSRCACRR